MLSRIRIIAVIAIGVGIFPHFSLANSPKQNWDLFSVFRPFESPAAKNDTTSNASTAVAYHRLAKNYADQNNVEKANANFGLALQHAASKQVAGIAVDYAAFLTGIGDLRGAELILRQALTQSPNDTELTRMLARCLVRQEKVIEGRRHLLLIGTAAEANAEITAIYREQGNTDMLARVEQRWGVARPSVISPATIEPDIMRPEPILLAEESKPAATPVRPSIVQALPRTQVVADRKVNDTPQVVDPSEVAKHVVPRDVMPRKTAVIAETPAESALSKSEFFGTRVPIPGLKSSPEPEVKVVKSQRLVPKQLALSNPVKLASVHAPIPSPTETVEPQKPAAAPRPRRHYVVNADASSDLEAILPSIRQAGQ